jgi:hypothetical protein
LLASISSNSFEYNETKELCWDLLANKFSIDESGLHILDSNICDKDRKRNHLDKIES